VSSILRRLGRPASTVVLLVLAAGLLGGCSELAGALQVALPTLPAASGPNAVAPSPSTPSNPSPPAPAAGGQATTAPAGGHVGSHAIVCLDPATAVGGGGPPCVPVTDALITSAAMEALTTAERTSVASSGYMAGAGVCAGDATTVGCQAPDAPVGVVTFQLRDGPATVRVLVYRRGDGTLGATRLT